MSYIWENYDVKNDFKVVRKNFVPYTEIFNMPLANDQIKVNILYRFADIYYKLRDDELDEKEVEILENTLIHLLANFDRFSGVSKKEVLMLSTYEEIKKGYYGINPESFDALDFAHKYIILSYMNMQVKKRTCYFFDCISEIFNTRIYYSEIKDTYIVNMTENANNWYGDEKKYTAKELYDIAKELLCDFWLKVEDYWAVPIGIINKEMYIDNIQLI